MKIDRAKVTKSVRLALIIIVSGMAGMILQKTVFQPSEHHAHAPYSGQAAEENKEEVWTCSMHPQIKLPKKGKCPICFMDLIPLEENAEDGGEREVSVSGYAAKRMELETAQVNRKFVEAEIRMVGKVDYDQTRISYISAWVPGRLDRLFINYTGIPVKKGDHMAEIYSPMLLTAKEELLQAIKVNENLRGSGSETIRNTALRTVEAARERLRLLGLTKSQIDQMIKTEKISEHITIHAPGNGIVIDKNAKEGMYVETGTRIYTIADLSVVWIQLDAYESDLTWLRYGGKVDFTVVAYPGKTFKGTISFIDPIINPSTRTAKVRVVVENPASVLKPGMFVRAIARPQVAEGGRVMNEELAGKWISPMHPEIVKDQPGNCDVCGMPLVTAESLGYVDGRDENAPLVIPVTAAMKTGKRAVVYVDIQNREKPTYEGREVQLGARLGDFYVVTDGLTEGERVVTRGAFKLDAEMQIHAKPSMMSAPSERRPEEGMGQGPMKPDPRPMKVPEAFSRQLEAVVQAYFGIQKALSEDNKDAGKTGAAILKEKLQMVDMGLLTDDGHMLWMDHLQNLSDVTGKLNQATTIEQQRKVFYPLSQELSMTLKTFPVSIPVHQGFCPMAFDNQGAIWLQQSEEVLNPYFGEVMLRCGEIEKLTGTPEEAAGQRP